MNPSRIVEKLIFSDNSDIKTFNLLDNSYSYLGNSVSTFYNEITVINHSPNIIYISIENDFSLLLDNTTQQGVIQVDPLGSFPVFNIQQFGHFRARMDGAGEATLIILRNKQLFT